LNLPARISSNANLQGVYGDWDKPDHWKLLRYDVGHMETEEGRKEIEAFLREHLG
jgi:hypothetical protein